MRCYVSMDPKPWPSNNMNQEGPLHCAVAHFYVCLFGFLCLSCVSKLDVCNLYDLYSVAYRVVLIIKEEKSGLIILVHSAYRLQNR